MVTLIIALLMAVGVIYLAVLVWTTIKSGADLKNTDFLKEKPKDLASFNTSLDLQTAKKKIEEIFITRGLKPKDAGENVMVISQFQPWLLKSTYTPIYFSKAPDGMTLVEVGAAGNTFALNGVQQLSANVLADDLKSALKS